MMRMWRISNTKTGITHRFYLALIELLALTLTACVSVILSSCQSVSHPWLRDELREWRNGGKIWQGMPVTPSSDEENQEAPLPQLVPVSLSDKDLNNVGVEIKWQGSLRVWLSIWDVIDLITISLNALALSECGCPRPSPGALQWHLFVDQNVLGWKLGLQHGRTIHTHIWHNVVYMYINNRSRDAVLEHIIFENCLVSGGSILWKINFSCAYVRCMLFCKCNYDLHQPRHLESNGYH